MITRRLVALAAPFGALALAACGTMSAPGVAGIDAQSYVETVEITATANLGSPTFGQTLRKAVLAEAARYGGGGKPLKLSIDLKKVHFKNAVKAMFLGDDNITEGHVTVLDPASGQVKGGFDIAVNADRGPSAGGVAMGLLSFIDPIGITDIAQAASGSGGGSKVEQAMSANFAVEALRQTYGETRARAVYTARRDPPERSAQP